MNPLRSIVVTLVAMAILIASCVAGEAATLAYQYVDRNGVVSYADELKHVPLAYRDQAVQVSLDSLGNYSRLTPVQATQGSPGGEEDLGPDVCDLAGPCYAQGVTSHPETGQPVGVALCPESGAVLLVPLAAPPTPTSTPASE